MPDMPNVTGIFTPSGAIAFIAGILVRRLWCMVKNKYLDRVDPANAPHRDSLKVIILAWGIIAAAIIYIGVQTQATYGVTVAQARSSQLLVERVAWDQYFAYQERCALTSELRLIVDPPQEIFDLHTTDPKYQAWARKVNMDYLKKLDAISERRQKVNDNPQTLPPTGEPKCES
jgi:hypothetical protein